MTLGVGLDFLTVQQRRERLPSRNSGASDLTRAA
jgi:hypothetical protein